jgi:hypothetical protein
MPFRVVTASCTNAASTEIVSPEAGDAEAWITVQPGSPAMYLGANSSVTSGSGYLIRDGDDPINTSVRYPNDVIWGIGTQSGTSSVVQVLFRTV